jgi:tRNA dimethylallyltransferase
MDAPFQSAAAASAVLIAGPTASGKSALALALAEAAERQGRAAVVINADSMQVYDALPILTARPSVADQSRAAHRLYGHVPAATRYSVGAWLADARPVLEAARRAGALPILVGGTGLYFKAAVEGLVAPPSIPAPVRRRWLDKLCQDGPAALHAQLAARDPEGAALLPPNDASRVARALEVLDATGHPLRVWQAGEGSAPLVGVEAMRLVIEPDRADLYARIGDRLDRMVEAGAVDEVRTLLSRDLDPDLPVMKAIGVREFAAVLHGRAALPDAVEEAKRNSRRYAKRQMTWFRNQMPDWVRMR